MRVWPFMGCGGHLWDDAGYYRPPCQSTYEELSKINAKVRGGSKDNVLVLSDDDCELRDLEGPRPGTQQCGKSDEGSMSPCTSESSSPFSQRDNDHGNRDPRVRPETKGVQAKQAEGEWVLFVETPSEFDDVCSPIAYGLSLNMATNAIWPLMQYSH